MRAAIAALVVVALTGSAVADRKQALTYFRAGEKAYQAQNFEAAATNFHEAFKALPLPEIAFSAAQAFRRAHRVRPNIEHVRLSVELYRFYLDKVKTGGRVGDAADSLESMLRELDKLGASARETPVAVAERTRLGITVNLGGEPRGDTMREISDEADTQGVKIQTFIDDKPVEPDQLHDVEPGDRVVRAVAEGFAPVERKERAIKDDSRMVPIELAPLPARVTITTEDGATVSIDGEPTGVGKATSIAAGRHVVRVARAGRRPVAREITVGRGETSTVAIALEPTLRRKAVPWVLAVTGGLALVTVGAVGFAAYEDDRAVDAFERLRAGNQDPQVGQDYEDARELRDRAVTGAWIVGGLTVAAGLATAYLYYLDEPSAEGVRVVPSASRDGAGAVIIGRF